MRYKHIILGVLCLLTVFATVNKRIAYPQVIPDDTLDDESSAVVNVDGDRTNQQVEGGAVRDANLFHSFRDFSIEKEHSLYFQSSPSIRNIITRITGSNPSEIQGTLGVIGGNSNVFLINPNGIVFGSEARLDVGSAIK